MRAEGCTEVQGYFVSEPVSVGEIDRLLAAYEARRRAAQPARQRCAPRTTPERG
jgi:hypothetical protein